MQWVECEPPEAGRGEVLVENRAIGINYIDTYIRSGLYSAPLPSGIGTEAAGVVVSVGSGVNDFKPGDRVVYGQSALGAYSEYHTVPADRLVTLPDYISFEQAAAVFMKGLTVHYLLCETYTVEKDECFLFHAAAGGVGLLA
ncbi:MAG: Quinone oxidoreductase 1 [Candidatus Erwinia impunctatus]|nr:Quinone oxidoreductase 1 [Culicoides impunctatus]